MSAFDFDRLGSRALDELRTVISGIDPAQFEYFITALISADKIVVYGVGREGLMMRALAMRLYHLGLDAHVTGDMNTPPVGKGDLLLISAGPGYFSTVAALAKTAHEAGASVACVTAQGDGEVPSSADQILVLPAQTMADDQVQSQSDVSVLPMGSLYEGAQYIAFELIVLALRERLDLAPEALRARHTNLE